ncbi:MAG TPA: HAD family phosphatase [Candidatus Moranbacteria bacterium]|nr:HAD family phosphatase [Candidatus Moranbacteria bacterium]
MIKAAFFDIDGTLISCQSQQELSKFMFKKRALSFASMLKLFFWFTGYKLGIFRKTVSIRKKMYRILSLKNKNQIDLFIKETYEKNIYPQRNQIFKSIIQGLKKRKYIVVGISGTLQQFCDFIKVEFDMDYAFGTKLCEEKERYSGRWIGKILEGEDKAEFIQKFSKTNNVDLNNSIFYGDSSSDIPSMKLVGKAIAVAPDIKLERLAKKKGWDIIDAGSF